MTFTDIALIHSFIPPEKKGGGGGVVEDFGSSEIGGGWP